MDRDRRLAYLVLKDIEDNGKWANLALSEHIAKEGAGSPAFVRELVYGCIRHQKLLDYNIARFLKKPGLSSANRVILRMGFFQLAFMDGVADYAAINETVEIAKAFKKGREGFINAVLRSFHRDGKRLLDDGLSTRYSCAQWIIDLWTAAYGAEKIEELLKESNRPAPLTIRANTAKISRDELAERLEKYSSLKHFEVSRTALSKLCLTVSGSGLLDTEEYRDGLFSVQGEASALAVEMLGPKPGDTVFDLCAAPGGKTCCAAELMKGQGRILAFDVYPHRIELIRKEAVRLGFSAENSANQQTAQPFITLQTADTSVFMPELEGRADCVIADVPCSGLGTLRRNPEIKLKEQSPAEAAKSLEELTKIQYNIMLNSARYLKNGGRMLYSTCTVDPAENEQLVRRALAELNPGPGPQLTIEKELQIFPQEGGPDGFYICVLRRR